MSSVVISGDTSGAITLSAPAVAGTNTVTIPAVTGTVMVSGNMPAFSAYQSSAQTGIATVTTTKITFDTEEFDTNNNFASSRFTPTVAGYYQVNGGATVNSITPTISCIINIYKNGSNYKNGCTAKPSTSNYATSIASTLVYLNGSTDYVELYIYGDVGVSYSLIAGLPSTFFSATLVRSA